MGQRKSLLLCLIHSAPPILPCRTYLPPILPSPSAPLDVRVKCGVVLGLLHADLRLLLQLKRALLGHLGYTDLLG